MECQATVRVPVYGSCSREAVVTVNGVPYCKQHAKRHLPKVQIVKGVENQMGLKKNLVGYIWS